jgi:DNA gyrase subunit A
MSLRPKDELFTVKLTDGKKDIIIGTKLGRAIRFKEKEIRSMGRQASGVKAIRLKPKDRVIAMIVVGEEDKFIFTSSDKGYGKKTDISLYPRHRRGGQGVINIKVSARIGNALAMLSVSEEEVLLISEAGKVIRIKTTQVRASGRATQGVRIIHLEEKDRLCSVAKVSES